ncbi:MAG: flagellar biosynthesis protein FlhB, partial [Pseudomonadota bacterium]
MSDQPDESEKTEDPSQHKLDEAHKKGDVPKSQEVNTWFVLTGCAVALFTMGGSVSMHMTDILGAFMGQVHDVPVNGANLMHVATELGGMALIASAPLVLVVAVFAAIGNLIQHKLVWSFESIKPKLSKLSPLAGFKRMFGGEALVNFGKGLAKLVIVSVIMAVVIWPQRDQLENSMTMSFAGIMALIWWDVILLFCATLAILTLVAAADLAYQRHKWFKKQKMTMKEVKDEHKQMEGDPHIKAKIRQIRMQRASRRMMAAVPQATVVVTNPTHYAVALKYEPGMPAPICLAKGTDEVALRIRQIADAHDIPRVENRPLARALHATAELDQE